MQPTKCLYDVYPYETKFSAQVISCEQISEGDKSYYEIILDQTMFFPEQGGQTPDRGVLEGVQILDVQIRDDVIRHKASEPLTVGDTVQGCVDWTYRFSNMQQHTGEHIFSGSVYAKYGYQNVGFHLSDSIVTMDFDGPLTPEQIEELETVVNQHIYENREVDVRFPSEEELHQMEYRSKKELQGPVRIVTIPDVDVCACCAPHVQRTGEIGIFKIMNAQNYKGGVRISFLCGYRALDAIRKQEAVLTDLMKQLSTNPEQLSDRVKRLIREERQLRYDLSQVKEKMVMEKIREVSDEQENMILFEDGLDAKVMRNVVNTWMELHVGVCGVFSGNDEKGYAFIIGSGAKDCRQIANELRESLCAKGGGSDKMIQGNVAATEEAIRRFMKEKNH